MLKIRIGTRKSQLALWQANQFEKALKANFNKDITTQIIKISTTGDKNLQSPLYKIGGKGLFIKELEQALLNDQIDLAVHSLKDVPALLASDFALQPVLKRELELDAFISKKFNDLKDLPVGAIVGTSSLRRQLQLKKINAKLSTVNIRGNLNTRLKKMADNKYDALILAAAGLIRLNVNLPYKLLAANLMLPALGQGILAVEYLKIRKDIQKIVTNTSDKQTLLCANCERQFLEDLQADCFSPVAGLSQIKDDQLLFKASIFSPQNNTTLTFETKGQADQAKIIGERLANKMLKAGAKKLLAQTANYYKNLS